jgi:hypothetical protein
MYLRFGKLLITVSVCLHKFCGNLCVGLLEEIPRNGSDSLPLLLGHLGVRAPYAT